MTPEREGWAYRYYPSGLRVGYQLAWIRANWTAEEVDQALKECGAA